MREYVTETQLIGACNTLISAIYHNGVLFISILSRATASTGYFLQNFVDIEFF